MDNITQKDFQSVDPKTGIQALLVEGSDPVLRTMEWTKENNYQFLSVADVYKKSGLEGIAGIGKDMHRWQKDMAEERRWGHNSPMRVEAYSLFNSYFLSQRIVEEIDKLPEEEFNKMKWFNFYVAHSPKIDFSTVKQDKDSQKYRCGSLLVSNGLTDKFNLQDISGIFKFDGAPWMNVAWLEGDLTKANAQIYENLFGQPIDNYKENLDKIGFRKSSIMSCPMPSMQLRADPVSFSRAEFILSDHPFWYEADKKDSGTRVDRIHVMPIMKNELYEHNK